ncbi:MAG TPA: hypothetical protein V6C71_10240 [Coleofasciculaceae cyanobacterium]|jgi:hypothetical protein
MNQISLSVLPTVQQSKLHQLQLEVKTLEEVEDALKCKMQLTEGYSSQSPILLVYARDRIDRTGIRFVHNAKS